MKLSGLIIETSPVHSTKSARPLSVVKFVFLCDNALNLKLLGVASTLEDFPIFSFPAYPLIN